MDILDLIEQLTDSDRWPGFRDPERLDKLDEIAENAFKRETFDGTLASILITHQICDELLRQLISQSRFALRLAVASGGFEMKFGRKNNDEDLDGLMTGQLLQRLESCIEFDEKKRILSLSGEMSSIRNKFAHELATRVDLDGIRGTATKYRAKFTELEELFEIAADNFHLYFKDHRKNDSWDFQLADMLENGLEAEWEIRCRQVVKQRRDAGFGDHT